MFAVDMHIKHWSLHPIWNSRHRLTKVPISAGPESREASQK